LSLYGSAIDYGHASGCPIVCHSRLGMKCKHS
jgi:hypothetical protein